MASVHRIVANDNSFDTGNIGANATSTAITVPSAGTELPLLDSPRHGRRDQRLVGHAAAVLRLYCAD